MGYDASHRHSGLDPESTGRGCPTVTLTFDSSPIKGEGLLVGLSCCLPSTTLWIPASAGNDGERSCFTLTFDSSPIKGEGLLVGVVLLSAFPASRFWIKSRMTVLAAPLDCGSSPQ